MKIYDTGYRGKLTPQKVMGILRKAGFAHCSDKVSGWTVSVTSGACLDDVLTAKICYYDHRPPRLRPADADEHAATVRGGYVSALRAAGLIAWDDDGLARICAPRKPSSLR